VKYRIGDFAIVKTGSSFLGGVADIDTHADALWQMNSRKQPFGESVQGYTWGNWPWGGYGAHPLPARIQRLWDQVKHRVTGGFPYSEGIYEDMNKAVVAQFYWDADRPARATLGEYIDYEFGAGVRDDVLTIVDRLESAASRSYRKEPVPAEEARSACDLAEAVNRRLPAWARRNWRWEILQLRAIVDRARFAGGGLETPAAEAALLRLIEIYHCQIDTDDPFHRRVRPPLKRATTRGGLSTGWNG